VEDSKFSPILFYVRAKMAGREREKRIIEPRI